ncbi:MAG: hypothetical protein M0R17_03645 [Candidatus Omnitrophica bacterium]|jgi:hypothetical protein|nr:hypothetical protein [Candidatus Omnitrophota bacterium]
MSNQIKNRAGKILGYLNEGIDRTEVRDSNNRTLAVYNRLNNETRDANEHFVGKGNLTARFIPVC